MHIYAESSIAFQAVQEVFKFSFVAVYISLAFIFTIINRQAVQLAKAYTSISDIIFTVSGEKLRKSTRKLNAHNVYNLGPNSANPNSDTGLVSSSNNANYNVQPFSTAYQPNPFQQSTKPRGAKHIMSYVYIFSILFLCAAYVGYPLKIVFGEISKPGYLPSPTKYSNINNTYYSQNDIFGQKRIEPYNVDNNYTMVDLYDQWKYTKNDMFDDNDAPTRLDIMGTTSYIRDYANATSNGTFSCGLQDSIQLLAISTNPLYSSSLNAYLIVPILHCSKRQFDDYQQYNALTYTTKDRDGSIKKLDTRVDRLPYAGSNVTSFLLSKDENNRAVLTANVLLVDSINTTSGLVELYNKTTGFAKNYYESLIGGVETFGYIGNQTFRGIIDPNSFSVDYIFTTEIWELFEMSAQYYSQNISHVISFSVKDEVRSKNDPRYNYYARSIISCQFTKDYAYNYGFLSYNTVYYRTETVQYVSNGPSNISPKTTMMFDDNTTDTYEIQMYPLLMNVKTSAAAHAILSAYAPDDSFTFFDAQFESPGRLKWDVTIQIYIIAILFGISIILMLVYLAFIGFTDVYTVPGYYELLREYHQKGSGSENSIRSIFKILKPAVVGKGYVAERDVNHIGILDQSAKQVPPRYDRPFMGKKLHDKQD